MESEAISFAVEDNRPEPERCNRMLTGQHSPVVCFDRFDSLIKAAMRIQVEKWSTIRRSRVCVLHEAPADEAISLREHRNRCSWSRLFLLQSCSQDSGVKT